MNRILRLLGISALLGLFAIAGLGYWAWDLYESESLAMTAPSTRIDIGKGASTRGIVQELNRKGISVRPWLFSLASRLRGDADRRKAGVYSIDGPITLRVLLDKLVKGDVVLSEIRFIEGWTFKQMRVAVAQNPDLIQDTKSLSEQAILQKIGATENLAEGLFFPSTYAFSPGSSDIDVYRQAYRQQKKVLEDAWAARSTDLPYANPYEMLIMASVIEKETGSDADRDKVAAVFVNRLRKGMLLQSDPTTIYGMGAAFNGNLRRKDLLTDTPYNTYTRRGLPPTPIALPGKASLAAATRPARIAALYFVARGDGSSEFSNDLSAHNRAVARFQLGKK